MHAIQVHIHAYITGVYDVEPYSGPYRWHKCLWMLMDPDLYICRMDLFSYFSLWFLFIILIPKTLWHLHIIDITWWTFIIMLSCWDPRPIAEILSDLRSTPYHSSDSILTILWESNTMLTKTPNSKYPLNPLMHYYCSPNSEQPWRTPITFLSSFVFIILF